jgi:hypothetical protein
MSVKITAHLFIYVCENNSSFIYLCLKITAHLFIYVCENNSAFIYLYMSENHSSMLHVNINTIPISLRLTILFAFGTNVDFVIGKYEGYVFFFF